MLADGKSPSSFVDGSFFTCGILPFFFSDSPEKLFKSDFVLIISFAYDDYVYRVNHRKNANLSFFPTFFLL